MKKFDIVVLGELNADLIFQNIARFPEMGKEILADEMTLTMGSASAILASNLARLGSQVGFAGKLGNDILGDLVLDSLEQRGVDSTGIIRSSDVKTGLTAVLSYPDDYAMITHMGAMVDLTFGEIDPDYLKSAKHLHVSSIYLQPGLREQTKGIFQFAREHGLTTSFDPGWDPEEQWERDILQSLQFVDIFLPNEQEALCISRENSLEDAVNTLKEYTDKILITRGSRGTFTFWEGKEITTTVYEVESVDTTGAGDSFNAGFLHAWLHGAEVHSALESAVACGAIATTKSGGSTASPNPDELQKFLESQNTNIFT